MFSLRRKYTFSYSHGHDHVDKEPALVAKTLCQAFDHTAEKYPENNFVTFPQDGIKRTFRQFQNEVGRWESKMVSSVENQKGVNAVERLNFRRELSS